MGTVAVSIVTLDGVKPVDGVLVSVYDELWGFISSEITDQFGVAVFSLSSSVGGSKYYVLFHKEGWSSSPQNEKDILVLDPPEPSTFNFILNMGTTGELVVLRIRNSAGESVDGISADIHDSQFNFITSGKTGDLKPGEILFSLTGTSDPGNLFYVYLYKDGFMISKGAVQKIRVISGGNLIPFGSGEYSNEAFGGMGGYPANSFDFVVDENELPVSSNPALCRLTGHIVNPSLNGIPEVIVYFKPLPGFDMLYPAGFMPNKVPVVNNKIVMSEVKVKTSSDGFLDVSLQRNCRYDVHIYGFEYPNTIAQVIRIPDASGAKLSDIFFPYIASVTYLPVAAVTNVGEYTLVEPLVLVSDGFPTDISPFAFVRFEIDNPDIANIEIFENKIKVVGKSIGSTDISVHRIENSYSERFESLPELTKLSVTVN